MGDVMANAYFSDRDNVSLATMAARVFKVNQDNGWFDAERTFGDDIALMHSEVSEAFEAYRDNGLADTTVSVAPESMLDKPEGVGSELADVLVRLLDTCHRYNIDLEAEFERKLAYNKTRSYKHGSKRV